MHSLWDFQSGRNQRLNSAPRCDVTLSSSIVSTVQRVDGELTCLSLPAIAVKPKMWARFSSSRNRLRG